MPPNHLSWQNCWVPYMLRLLCADFFKILAITQSFRRLISAFLGSAGSYRYSGSGMRLGSEAISIIGTMKLSLLRDYVRLSAKGKCPPRNLLCYQTTIWSTSVEMAT